MTNPFETEISGDYYSRENNEIFMSVSQLKGFIECEARQKAIVDGEFEQPDLRAFFIGHYVHTAFEGEEAFEDFKAENAHRIFKGKALTRDDVIFNYRNLLFEHMSYLDGMHEGLYRLTMEAVESAVLKTVFNAKKEIDKIQKYLEKKKVDPDHAFRVCELLTDNEAHLHKRKGEPFGDVVKADAMIEAIKRDELAMGYMTGEKEVSMTGELFGCKWKIRIDNVNFFEGFFSDLKTTGDIYGRHFSPRHMRYVSFIDRYGYDMQMAVYQQILHQNTGELMDPFIVAVSKEDLPNIAVVAVDPERLENALDYIGEKIERAVEVKTGAVEPNRCERCDYCKQTKKLTKVVTVDSLLQD